MARDFDQIRTDSPFSALDGTETIVLNQGAITKGGYLSVVREWIQSTIGTTFGRSLLQLDELTDLTNLTTPQTATQTEMEEGTEEELRSMSPALVSKAIENVVQRSNELVDDDVTLTDDHMRRLLVCDAPNAIEVDLAVPSTGAGFFWLVNLSVEPVVIGSDTLSILTPLGPELDVTIPQYGFVNAIYLGADTWYIKETTD